MSTSDVRHKTGAPTPTDPITGLPKAEKETIIAFAQRHGWDVRVNHKDEWVEEWRLVKGLDVVDLELRPSKRGSGKGSIATATLKGVQLPQYAGFPTRERVEKFLTGVPCVCSRHEGLYSYEEIPNPSCLIHGDAVVHSALTEQANPGGMSTDERLRA